MGESPRWFVDKSGNYLQAPPNIFYFTKSELSRGHRRRINHLAELIVQYRPDIIFLQEVGAGFAENSLNNDIYYKHANNDFDWMNSALRLTNRVTHLGYSCYVSCRGNIGWITGSETFQNHRIFKGEKSPEQLVYDFGANPYPNGVMIEGYAILIKSPWHRVYHQGWDLIFNAAGDKVNVQMALITNPQAKKPNSPQLMLVNVHCGHKLVHFEQAVRIRKAITAFLRTIADHTDLVVAGDFNAELYRPSVYPFGEISTVPWEIFCKNTFDFRTKFNPEAKMHLINELTDLNLNKNYKPWASVENCSLAQNRIKLAVQAFIDWQIEEEKNESTQLNLQPTIPNNRIEKTKVVENNANLGCDHDQIDHIFVNQNFTIKGCRFLSKSDGLNSVSDHPIIFATYEIEN